jgi:hypothetical protein
MPGSPQWSLFLRFPHQNLYKPLASPIHEIFALLFFYYPFC